jgi:hypothetical protein
MKIRWGRIVLGGFLSELAIGAVILPLNAVSSSVAYYAVPVLVVIAAFVFGRWVAAPLTSSFVLHGVLTAVVASLLYIALTAVLGVLSSLPLLYHLSHGPRLLGGAAGGASVKKSRRHQ